MISQKIKVYIEIEKDSNIKYELNKKTNKLEAIHILPNPFVYPYAYGFIPDTLALDGDNLDILIITDKILPNDTYYNVYIIGVLIIIDNKGMNEKLLCVLEEDYSGSLEGLSRKWSRWSLELAKDSKMINDICKLNTEIKNNIYYFFANYKKKRIGKWSNVIGYENKDYAIKLYNKTIISNI
jgi:inorganic pyrophosphatase